MAQLRLTKNELRAQEAKFNQLSKYLPTLQLKKALIQAQVAEAKNHLANLLHKIETKKLEVGKYASLLGQKLFVDVLYFSRVKDIHKHYENIAGAEIPIFDEVTFHDITYTLFDTPIWLEGMIFGLRSLSTIKAKIIIMEERKMVLEKELREVSIRVNLFEKVLIPRCERNIKTIKVFLGDMTIAAIGQAKVAKNKIEREKIKKRDEI